MAKTERLFLLQGTEKIDIWKMGDTRDISHSEGSNYKDTDVIPCDSPVHLVSLNTGPLRASALAPNGRFFAFSTEDKIRIYSLEVSGIKVAINKESVSANYTGVVVSKNHLVLQKCEIV